MCVLACFPLQDAARSRLTVYLDEKTGVVYSKKRIDREVFCAKVASEASKLADVKLNKQIWSSLSNKNKSSGRLSNKSSRNATSHLKSVRRKLQKRHATPVRKYTNSLNPSLVFKPSILLNTKFHDSVNCDCKSEKCELNFRFIAFKDKDVLSK